MGLGRGLLAGLGSPSLTQRTRGALRPWLILHGSSICQCRLPLGRTPSFQASLGGAAEGKAPRVQARAQVCPGACSSRLWSPWCSLRGSAQLALLIGCYVLSRSQPPQSCPPFPPPKTPSLYLTCPSGATEPTLQKPPPVASAPQPGGLHLLSNLHLSHSLRVLFQLPSLMPFFLPSFLPSFFPKASQH